MSGIDRGGQTPMGVPPATGEIAKTIQEDEMRDAEGETRDAEGETRDAEGEMRDAEAEEDPRLAKLPEHEIDKDTSEGGGMTGSGVMAEQRGPSEPDPDEPASTDEERA
jgi:hypothetical protein